MPQHDAQGHSSPFPKPECETGWYQAGSPELSPAQGRVRHQALSGETEAHKLLGALHPTHQTLPLRSSKASTGFAAAARSAPSPGPRSPCGDSAPQQPHRLLSRGARGGRQGPAAALWPLTVPRRGSGAPSVLRLPEAWDALSQARGQAAWGRSSRAAGAPAQPRRTLQRCGPAGFSRAASKG